MIFLNDTNPTKNDLAKDFARNIAIATSNLIPGVGGVLSVFLDKYLPNTIEKRRNDFLRKLSHDFERFSDDIIIKLSNDEKFHSLVLQVFKSVIQEHQAEKIVSFRNIIINSALSNISNEVEFYLRLVEELTSDQIKVLHLFYLKDKKRTIDFKNINKYIDNNWTGIDESYRFALVTELIRFGLITGSQRSQEQLGEGQHLSDFGMRFITYIFQPHEI